jgi:hypothetical protein
MINLIVVDILLDHLDTGSAAKKIAGFAKTSLTITRGSHFQLARIEAITNSATSAKVSAYLHFIAHCLCLRRCCVTVNNLDRS